ncbi:MAG: type II secretion system protein M [Sulfuricaulis sp.]|uniref:type II secretion system protein M n=1 Tax=Sulfuricaulis sp. TaxID=2003553 RepID=UPI0025F6AEF4|nr:type II secretion system protein M [Sulfuricaulis sp.]MCR4347280.1 type II secretion system protein M [Sulfuricaulis sp.]
MIFKDTLRNFTFERLRALPPRDRWLLIGGAVGLLLVVYLSLWLPMQRELSRLRASVPQGKIQLAQMRVQAMEISQLRASGRVPQAGGNLLVNLEQSATANGIRSRIIRMEPEGNGGARLSLEGVHFNALIGWLASLQNQGGVRIEKATFEAQPAAGTVNARLVLRSAGG